MSIVRAFENYRRAQLRGSFPGRVDEWNAGIVERQKRSRESGTIWSSAWGSA